MAGCASHQGIRGIDLLNNSRFSISSRNREKAIPGGSWIASWLTGMYSQDSCALAASKTASSRMASSWALGKGMKMPACSSTQELNRQLARKINEEALRNPQSPYANKFVGIANGQIVVVADDPDDLARRLRQAEPDPAKTFWVEASRNYDQVEYIWSLR
jgi:hypothetical protein